MRRIGNPITAVVAVLFLLLLLIGHISAVDLDLNEVARALDDTEAMWGSGFSKAAKKTDSRIKEQAASLKKQAKGEAKEQAIRSATDDAWNGAEEAETEVVNGRHGRLQALTESGGTSLNSQADAGISAISGAGSWSAGKMGEIGGVYQNELAQVTRASVNRLLGIEHAAQGGLQRTMEALREIRDSGMVHMRRRGDEKEEQMRKDDLEHEKQIANTRSDYEWRLEQRALRTEKRLDRLLQNTRDLLKKRDDTDEARATALESQLDKMIHDAETKLMQRRAKAALLRLARTRLAEEELSTQRARAQHERAALLKRAHEVNARLHVDGAAIRARLAQALQVADSARYARALRAQRRAMTRAARRAMLTASGLGGSMYVPPELMGVNTDPTSNAASASPPSTPVAGVVPPALDIVPLQNQ